MTTAYRHETKQETGVWVRVHSQSRNVWVSDAEINAALNKDGVSLVKKYPRSRTRIAENIALGKAIGSYREWRQNEDENEA